MQSIEPEDGLWILPPHPPAPSPPEEEKGRKNHMLSLTALLMLLPIERNKNVTYNSQCNTKLLAPQPQAQAEPRFRKSANASG